MLLLLLCYSVLTVSDDSRSCFIQHALGLASPGLLIRFIRKQFQAADGLSHVCANEIAPFVQYKALLCELVRGTCKRSQETSLLPK